MENLQIEIFNTEKVESVEPTFNISWEDIENAYRKLFSDSVLENVNIVFTNLEYIQDLNKKYRDIDAPTDVLSFQISEDGKVGEIYICPEYAYRTFQGNDFEEEILRLIVHGTLHLLGYDHQESLDDNPQEEMFVIQEKLVVKMLSLCS